MSDTTTGEIHSGALAPSMDVPAPSAATSTRRWWVLAVLCLSLFLVVVDNTIVNVALPTLSTDLNAGTTELQWIVDAYTLVFAALLLAFGHLGDRFGRKGALQLGMALFALTSVLAALSATSGQLVSARALMGIGAALVFPATLAILVNVFTDRKERAAAIGIWSGVTGLAVALGPVSGGYLLEHFWWGSIFLVNVPIAVVAILGAAWFVPTSRDPDTRAMDWWGLITSAAAVALLVWAIIEGPRVGWTSTEVLLAGGFALALLSVFILWERRCRHPLLDVSIFSNLRFSAASGAVAAAFFGLFGFIFLITQFMQLVQGYSPLEAGLRTVPFALATALTAPIAIAVMHRVGSTLVVGGGLLLMSAGFLLASRIEADSDYFGIVLASMVVMAVGLGLTTGPATESIMGALPAAKAGVGSAVNDTTRELGGTLGVALVGSVFASVYAPKLREAVAPLGLPQRVQDAAAESMGSALVVVQQLPRGVADEFIHMAQRAFMDGFTRGSLVAAAATLIGGIAVFLFLPARHAE